MLDEKLTNKIEEVDARLSARMDKLDSRMDGLESRMDRLENRMDKLDSRMDGLESRMDKLENRMDKLDSRMDGLESGMDKLEKRVDNMDGRFSTRLDNIEDKVTSMDRTIRHDIVPQLATVSSICAEAMEKYIKTADKIEYVQADVEMLKRVTADHHEQLKKLNKSKQ